MKKLVALFVLFAFNLSIFGQTYINEFSADKLRERVKRLSADDFEGRGPGNEGGKLATQYIADQLKASGIQPANNGSYFQMVTLFGAKANPATTLNVKGTDGNSESYKFGDDFVATVGSQKAKEKINAELVFAGYGIDSPIYKWNDYKGDADNYRGKILMILVNDPPANSEEPNLFGGRALTYYGRWTYKYEEAARKGAAGVILVHTTESAGYGWNVVRTSNGNWRYEVARGKSDKTPFLKIKSWATDEVSGRILKQAGLNLDELREKAKKRDFQPVKTGLKIKLKLESESKTFDSPNVVAKVDGTDAKLKDEYVAWSAHWDHLGIGEANKDGDKTYNGAYDNASGVSSVMAIAEALNRRPTKRSHIFVFTTAEEQGLIGAEYYAKNPIVPLNKTIANLNLDGTNVFGKTSDFMALGAERSSLMSYVKTVADERNMTLNSDQRPEQGFFFRSDHFPFAKAGVPCISFQHGSKFIEKLSPIAESFHKEYGAKHYHQPSDQFGDWMDFSAMVQQCEYSLAIGINVANTDVIPRFNDNDEFSIADKARFAK